MVYGIALIGSGMVRTMNKEQQEFWDKLKHGNRGCLNCGPKENGDDT